MATAPFCEVTVVSPGADPTKSSGLKVIPKGANSDQITNIVNYNFKQLLKGNFVEQSRTTQTVRVFDPSDKSVYVDVHQITGIVFINKDTNQTIVWKQGKLN